MQECFAFGKLFNPRPFNFSFLCKQFSTKNCDFQRVQSQGQLKQSVRCVYVKIRELFTDCRTVQFCRVSLSSDSVHFTIKDMNTPSLFEVQTWLVYQRVAIDCAGCLFMTDNAFKARDIGLRAQKKILSRMATKSIAKAFIDGTTASLLDNIYRLAKIHSGSKKDAEKLVKNIIKIVIKIGVLHRNGQFSAEEERAAQRFRNKFQNTQMAIISFYEVDFSFDLPYLQKAFAESHATLKDVVRRHLTDKSLNRIDEVFDFFSDASLLETAFKIDSPYRELMGKIVTDLNDAMDKGDL